MTLTPNDWKVLRNPIIILGAVLISVGVLASFADQYRTSQQTALMQQQREYQQALRKFESSGQEKETIIKYLPEYNHLLNIGFIGEERRIEWIERLRQIHGQYNLFSIDYNIGQQEHYKPAFINNMGSHILNRSVMELTLDMLHEGDLINLLGDLHINTPPFMVRDCEITRPIGAEISSKQLKANLKARCELDWLTLRDPELGKHL